MRKDRIHWDKKFRSLPPAERCRLVRQEIDELRGQWAAAQSESDWFRAGQIYNRMRWLYRRASGDGLLVRRWAVGVDLT